MKASRRAILTASLGLSQLTLLDRFGLLREARADTGDRPTRLLVLYLQGGTRFHTFFCPFTPDEVLRYIPPPGDALGEPVFFTPDQLLDLAPASQAQTPLRLARLWNPADPADRAGGKFTPMGYSWKHYDLAPHTVAFHGVDHNSVAHGSAYVASMCGVASENYRAPGMISVVANHLYKKFADKRPLPCVAIRPNQVPSALSLPSISAPNVVPSLGTLASVFSSDPTRNPEWAQHEARSTRTLPAFDDGDPVQAPLTDVDDYVLDRTRALKGLSSPDNDGVLQQIHDTYLSVSATLARDLVTLVEKTNAFDSPAPDHLKPFGRLGFTFGAANGSIRMNDSLEWALRVLKSGISTAVYAYLPEVYYDTHNGSTWPRMTASLRAQMDMVAQVIGELKATPSPDQPGKSLYEDTIVVVTSEFGRTWAVGPEPGKDGAWQMGDDHNNISSVILSGGNLLGNQQIGGFTQHGTDGKPVSIQEGSGGTSSRKPFSADVLSTLYRAYGMQSVKDFKFPGLYGEIQGVVPT